MLFDRTALDLPDYDGLLAGHYDRGSGYSRRRTEGTDDWLLIRTLAGEGRFGTPVEDVIVRAPNMTLLAPGTPHDYGTARESNRWEIQWVHFQPPTDWLDLLRWPLVASGLHSFEPTTDPKLDAAFNDVLRLSVATVPRRTQWVLNALERLLLICDMQIASVERKVDDRVRMAIEHIHSHLSQTLALSELADIVHLSPGRFAHLFRQEIGIPPRQYVLLQRIQRAKTLLERTTLGVAEIAGEVGMDPFHLSLRFKAETGLSPTGYRTRSRRA
jgi:AraC family transcriptional regulator of arabinose operon